MSGPLVWAFTAIIVTLFVAFAHAARRGRLSGRSIVLVGIGIGLIATVGTALLLLPTLKSGAPPSLLGANVLMMAFSTAFCIVMAQRQARVEDIARKDADGVVLIGRVASPYRLTDLDALLLPTSTHLRSLSGPSAQVLTAAGRDADIALRKRGAVKLDKLVTIPAGKLPVGKLILFAAFEPSDLATDPARLRRGLEAALLAARKTGATRPGLAYAKLRGLSDAQALQLYRDAALKHGKAFKSVTLIALDGRGEAALRQVLAE